jgi:ABC-type branched-subunit amino acid transport system substrate-binding protein
LHAVAAATSLACGLAALAASPAGDARRGRRIYLRGEGSSGEVLASLEDGSTAVHGSVLPCASCHGHDGEGRPEGGVTPSAITWERLTKPYGLVQEGGRSHPPYTEGSLARAITEGVDPAGNPLQMAMPRYRMSPADLSDLIAYLQRVGHDGDPGVADGALVLGTFVPAQGAQAAVGETMRSVLAALIGRVNAEGGIYGRRLELRALRPDEGAKDLQGIFALVGGLPGASHRDLAALAETYEVPLVAPVVLDPRPASPPGRFVFYLLPGLREQTLALASFAAQTIATGEVRALIVHPDLPRARELAKALELRGRGSGWAAVETVTYPVAGIRAGRVAAGARRSGSNAVFFLGPAGDARAFLLAAARTRIAPALFVEGSLAGRGILDVPAAFAGPVYVAFPAYPLARDSEQGRDFRELVGPLGLASGHEAFQAWAYTAGRITLEALRSAGRRLDRERFITALEGLYDFDAGGPAPIRYGPERRVGVAGATMARVDREAKRLVHVRDWVSADP